jgi:hypothetical protein
VAFDTPRDTIDFNHLLDSLPTPSPDDAEWVWVDELQDIRPLDAEGKVIMDPDSPTLDNAA